MNRTITLRVPFILALIVTSCVFAGPEFSGILTLGGKTYLGLRDDDGKPFEWRAVGEEVGEFRVTSYEDSTETVTLTRGGSAIKLRLKGAAVESLPTVGLVERLALSGDTKLEKLLPNLKKLEGLRDKTLSAIAEVESRGASEEKAWDQLSGLRRKLKIEEDNLEYFVRDIVGISRKAVK